MHCFLMGIVEPGDEIVMFEPAFPGYYEHIEMSGGILKSMPLSFDGKTWTFKP